MIETYTRKYIRNLIKSENVVDLTKANMQDYDRLQKVENGLDLVGVSVGTYSLTGKVLKGRKTGEIYAIGDNTPAIYIFS